MKEKIIYALGFFDGVHLGHAALLRQCCALAEQTGAIPGALTFDSHPDTFVRGNTPPLLNTAGDRRRLLEQQGVSKIVTLPFDERRMKMPWQDFFRLLVEEYAAAGLVCGSDFRFGHRGEGTAERLCSACEAAGIPCRVVTQQYLDGIRVSSTHIRTLLEQGEMETAVAFLGHPHIFTGTVEPGQHIGRTIGIPTANLRIPKGLLVPKCGVYACKARLENGEEYLAVTNIGSRPTVGGRHLTVEPWLLDFAGDLYGKTLTLEFYQYLRPEKKFCSLEELRTEIRKNEVQTRKFFGK